MLDTIMNTMVTFQYIWSSMLPSLNLLAEGGDLKFIGVGLCSIAFLGVALGQGIIGAYACEAIGRNPEAASKITTTGMIFAGVTESGAIYGLIIAVLLIFVV